MSGYLGMTSRLYMEHVHSRGCLGKGNITLNLNRVLRMKVYGLLGLA